MKNSINMTQLFKKCLFVAATVIVFAGCSKDEAKCDYDPCAVVAPQTEIQSVKDYLSSKNITDAVQHCSGLFYRIENGGTGTMPQSCSNVAANYKGMLTDGRVFDQSASPATFNLQGVIKGWTNGLPLIKSGGRIILYIPPTLGYGSQEIRDQRTNDLRIPANSILIFEVDLVAAQ
jgi:FKBP-type peptidyl-prolyl cis-trans isomerase FkpA